MVGFSVRADLSRGYGGLASFVYGYPPDIFRFYFWDGLMRTKKVSSTLRSKLLAFGVFRESGNWTLEANLTQENLARMNEVYDFILDQVDQLVKAQQK